MDAVVLALCSAALFGAMTVALRPALAGGGDPFAGAFTTVVPALCVALGPIARIKCVATLAGARRTGAAEAVMHTAMSWAKSAGARRVALGVTEANGPARQLYAKLGFTLAGRYHIRARSSG